MPGDKSTMNACVIGAGPAGLFTSKFLAKNGINVKLFEKDKRTMGNYNYARGDPLNKNNDHTEQNTLVTDVLTNPRIQLFLNVDHSKIKDEAYDFYVCAAGGIEKELEIKGKELAIKAMDIIRGGAIASQDASDACKNESIASKDACNKVAAISQSISNMNNILNVRNTSDKNRLCIIGMGNVSMDLISYLQGKCKELTVLSRSKLKNAAFDNHKLREIVESKNWDISVNTRNSVGNTIDRKTLNRYKMLLPNRNESLIDSMRNIISHLLNIVSKAIAYITNTSKPKLNLIFDTKVESIEKVNKGKLLLKYRTNGGLQKQVFDSIISSIGFIPNRPDIKTSKPVYYVGWSLNPRGSINDSKIESELVVERILSDIQ